MMANVVRQLMLVAAGWLVALMCSAQTWIWFPGDLDIWMGNKVNSLRMENGGMWPAFWRMDSHEQSVSFSKTVELAEEEVVEIAVEGKFSIRIDGRFGCVDAQSKATRRGRSVTMPKRCKPTHGRRLPTTLMQPVSIRTTTHGDLFATFAHEEIGYLQLCGVKGEGQINIYYGESEDEALDKGRSYLCDKVRVSADSIIDLATRTVTKSNNDYTLPSSRAMRYVTVECEGGVSISGVKLMSEMKPLDRVASFECSDTLLNRIWQVGIHTLHLTDREVMIEGIKRDRWMWSGDAIQSYLMNYYAFMDIPVVRRTIWALRGKDPVEQHINTILDYTFFWLISVSDYYHYTADSHFVRQVYPRMRSLMDYVEGRLNEDGLVEGRKGDWVFVDWSLHGFPKDGQLSFQQLVYLRSLDAIAECAGVIGNRVDAQRYSAMADHLRQRILSDFWSDDAHALIHSTKNGQQRSGVTRYELEALCVLGQHQYVMQEMRDYWGGMLQKGATTFWETYDPNESYPERLAMYGHPYGKSLCHAWGASPIYLLGRYYLGVTPTKPGYAEWEVRPCLGGLKWMKGTVPTPNGGSISIEMNRQQITLHAEGCGQGTLIYRKQGQECSQPIDAGKTYIINKKKVIIR